MTNHVEVLRRMQARIKTDAEDAALTAAIAALGVQGEAVAWLESLQGVNLVSDDGGKWAVSGDGFQPVPESGGFTETVSITSFVDPDYWKPTIAEAIAYFRAQHDDDAALA